MGLYWFLYQKLGWSARETDETDFETLCAFIGYKQKPDKDIAVIGGKHYRRASGVPDWL